MKRYTRDHQNSADGQGNRLGHNNRRNFHNNNKNPNQRRIGPPPHMTGYERSVWLMNSFKGRCVELRDGEGSEGLMRRFKRVMEQSGVMRELKSREYYLTKTQKKKEKSKKAQKRLRKLEKRMGEYQDEDIKPMNSGTFSDMFGN